MIGQVSRQGPGEIQASAGIALSQDKVFAVEVVVVDLAKDPFAAGPLARSTIRNSNVDNALDRGLSPKSHRIDQSDPQNQCRSDIVPRQVDQLF